MITKIHPVYGAVKYRVDVKEDDKCSLCLHRHVCHLNMSELCENYECGTSEKVTHDGCVHRHPHFDKEGIPCFRCRFFMLDTSENDQLLRDLWKRLGSEVAQDSLIDSMEQLKNSIYAARSTDGSKILRDLGISMPCIYSGSVTWSYAIFESMARVEVFLRLAQVHLKDWDRDMDNMRNQMSPEEQETFRDTGEMYKQVERIRGRIYERMQNALKIGEKS